MFPALDNILDTLLLLIENASGFSLFGALLLGIVFAPINRETIVVFMALVAASNVINPFFAYVVTVLATSFGYSLGFFLAKIFSGLLNNPSPKAKKKLERSDQLLKKYGTYAIMVSYYIPGARHFLPVLIGGMGSMSTAKFMLNSKLGSMVWTATFFIPGYYLGDFLPF
ncbi:membrane protein DedA with SNARE-associated domain [Desulfitispora alkaliphila]|uniref:DedA family protein n=1 Tax=Desulfitispora alkaliphila TaxID=622674 RepID=UPI003D218271